MNIVSHTKCNKCAKIRNEIELKESQNGIGKVCINEELCKKEQMKNKIKESQE